MKRCGDSSISRIYLMLGSSCNLKCRYCLQTNMKCNIAHEPTEEVYNYINHLIKLKPDFYPELQLTFWGGEPLLYFDLIKKIVERINSDKILYGVVTNGSLLTKEMVKYFNKNNITVTISNDGINTKLLRGLNILEDSKKLKLIKKIKNLTFECVTSAYSYDYATVFNYIESKIGRDVTVKVDALRITWDMPDDIYAIPLDQYEDSLRFLAGQAFIDTIAYKDTNAVGVFKPYVDSILDPVEEEHIAYPRCGAFYHSADIDCDGNVYMCHNSGEVLGVLSDKRFDMAAKYEEWLSNRMNKECEQCEVFNLCGGGCPLEHQYRDRICAIYKTFYTVCSDLANALKYSYEPVDLGC